MAEITIEFTGQVQDLHEVGFALFETEALQAGTQKEIPGAGTLTMQPMMVRKAYGIPQFIEVVLSIGSSDAAEIASNYIYGKLKKHKAETINIRINRHVMLFNNRNITKMINKEILVEKHAVKSANK
jgi:hypothetical protein